MAPEAIGWRRIAGAGTPCEARRALSLADRLVAPADTDVVTISPTVDAPGRSSLGAEVLVGPRRASPWVVWVVVATACGRQPEVSTAPGATASQFVEIACETGPLEAKGDLDGLVAAIEACGATTPLAQQMLRVDTLVSLGEVELAKVVAASVLASAKEPGRAAPLIAARAQAVVDMPEPPRRAADDLLAEAHALVERARASREPERWIALAKAKHALARATSESGQRCLIERGKYGMWAADHPIWSVVVHPVPIVDEGRFEASAVTEVDARTGALRAVRLIAPAASLREQVVVALPTLGPSAFAAQTPAGIRVFYAPGDRAPIDHPGSIAATPDGETLLVWDSKKGIAALDVGKWRTRWEQPFPLQAPRISNDAIVAGGDPSSGDAAVIDVATGEARLHEYGWGALSPSRDRLAVFVQKGTFEAPDWRLLVVDLTTASPVRSTSVDASTIWPPKIAFDGEEKIRVTQRETMSRYCTLHPVAVVDARTGRIVSRGGASTDCTVWPPRESPPKLEGSQLSLTLEWSPDVLVVSRAGKEIQRVALPRAEGGTSLGDLALSADERYVAVCGRVGDAQDSSFVVELATGRATLVRGCAAPSFFGTRLFTPTGLVDLSGGTEPLLPPFVDEVEAKSLANRSTVPTDTIGLHCRFGELLEPYEVCGPPPSATP